MENLYRRYTLEEVEEEALMVIESCAGDEGAIKKRIAGSAEITAGPMPDADPFAPDAYTLSVNRRLLFHGLKALNQGKSDDEIRKLVNNCFRDSHRKLHQSDRFTSAR